MPGAKPVTVERIKIHGTALEGNLEGDAVDRNVLAFLPPSYQKDKPRRYPVVYALHGYSIGAEQWSHEIHVQQTIEGAFARGAKEMIMVLPIRKRCTTAPCVRVRLRPETLSGSSRTMLSDTSTLVTARFRSEPEVDQGSGSREEAGGFRQSGFLRAGHTGDRSGLVP